MSPTPVKIAVSGCAGRMGRRIVALALADEAFAVAGAVESAGNPVLGQDVGSLADGRALGVRVTDQIDQALQPAEVLIEFSKPEATVAHVQAAQRIKRAIVIGTTGLSDAQRAAVVEASRVIPVLFSPNMSIGVNLLFELARTAAARLGLRYDVEVIEAHHRAKVDAPSGTAKRLMEVVAEARGQQPADIPAHAVRAGDIAGDHTVLFAGPFERLELTHRAGNRDVFALGALKAAQFLRAKPAGLYDMSHVLGA
jgi:4-hydroxy-tetrahydrodipicolinate reductase